LEVCTQFSEQINVMDQDEWKLLADVENFKHSILEQFESTENGEYVNISCILPRINSLLSHLKSDFKSLVDVKSALASGIEQKLACVMDCKQEDFDPTYFQATFLNPTLYGTLNEEQMEFVKGSLEELVSKRMSKLTAANSSELQEQNANLLIESYHKYIHDNQLELKDSNALEFWTTNYETHKELAHFALKLLTIPISATIPHDFIASNSNPFDFIKMTQNVEDLNRNAIIRLNGHLSCQERKPSAEVSNVAQKRKVSRFESSSLNESGQQQFGIHQFGTQQFGIHQFGTQQFGIPQFGTQQSGIQRSFMGLSVIYRTESEFDSPATKIPRKSDLATVSIYNINRVNFNCQ